METYCSIAEAWGDPDIDYADENTEDSQLTFQEMHNLPGYGNLLGGKCAPPTATPLKKTREVREPKRVQSPARASAPVPVPVPSALQQMTFDIDSDSQAHILNALLYIVSGIYLIYTMDMFMRMGMHMK
tara:strand:- start:1631 stop:2017 length:387 start_codon:yes stop_codon:yes gene_type:complete